MLIGQTPQPRFERGTAKLTVLSSTTELLGIIISVFLGYVPNDYSNGLGGGEQSDYLIPLSHHLDFWTDQREVLHFLHFDRGASIIFIYYTSSGEMSSLN